MFLLLFLMACADPAPVAQQACEALPVLAADPASLELLAPVLAQADYDALTSAAPTQGLETVGAEGLAALRGKASCTVKLVESAGQGRWAIDLQRSLPVVQPDGSLGEPETVELAYQAVKTPDGIRIETGLAGAAITRKSAETALDEGDLRRWASTWRAIANKFPDPLITVDIAKAEAVFLRDSYRSKIVGKPVGIDEEENTLKGEISNTGKQAASAIQLRVDFAVGEETVSESTTIEALAQGAKAEIAVPIPEGADGKVHIEVLSLEF